MILEQIYMGIEIYRKPNLCGGHYYFAPNLTTVYATVNFAPSLLMMRQFIREESEKQKIQ